MLSKDVFEELNSIISAISIDKYSHLEKLLSAAEKEYYSVINQQNTVALTRERSFETTFNRIHRLVREISQRGLFANLSDLDKSLELKSMKNKIYLKTISELRSAIKEVSKTAEQYFATTNDNFLLMVLLFNAILYQRLSNSFIMQTSQLDEQINSKPAIQDSTNIKRLRLSLDSDYTFNQFISKLVAISRIYNEIANLTGVSTTEYPIVLVKVESGSSLQDILGYRKIIELMEKLIVDTTEYFHRNFTTEGKISTISTKVETIETLLKLRQKLRASGINTDNMDESINNSSLIVAEELNKLLIGAPNVKLNELMLSIGDDFKDKYLEASDPYLLDSGLNDYD